MGEQLLARYSVRSTMYIGKVRLLPSGLIPELCIGVRYFTSLRVRTAIPRVWTRRDEDRDEDTDKRNTEHICPFITRAMDILRRYRHGPPLVWGIFRLNLTSEAEFVPVWVLQAGYALGLGLRRPQKGHRRALVATAGCLPNRLHV